MPQHCKEQIPMTIAERPARDMTAAAEIGSTLDAARRHGLDATSAARRHAVERLARLCEEGLRFANCRMEENRRTFSEIAAARTLPDVLPIWSRYVELAAQQYSEELQLMSDLHSQQVWEAVDDLQQGIATVIETTRFAERS
jgi:hypothetical protein